MHRKSLLGKRCLEFALKYPLVRYSSRGDGDGSNYIGKRLRVTEVGRYDTHYSLYCYMCLKLLIKSLSFFPSNPFLFLII